MVPSVEVKPYLKDHFLSKRITDVDLLTLSALPHGLDQQEWIATHSEYLKHEKKEKRRLNSMSFTKPCDDKHHKSAETISMYMCYVQSCIKNVKNVLMHLTINCVLM